MIESIRHKGLRDYWVEGNRKGLDARWLRRLTRILAQLDVAPRPEALNLPGYHFHALTGNRAGRYSVRLTGNYRVTFGWGVRGPTQIDIEDYH